MRCEEKGGAVSESTSPITDDAFEAFNRRACGLHLIAHKMRGFERDLTECLATLRDVEGYLERGQCGCESRPYSTDCCGRCLMLADVKATIGNCEP